MTSTSTACNQVHIIIPMHMNPSPVNPGWQTQVKSEERGLSCVQTALESQGSSRQGSRTVGVKYHR